MAIADIMSSADGKSILSFKTKKAIQLIYCNGRLLSCLNPHHYVILNGKERKTEKEIRLFCLPFFHLLYMQNVCKTCRRFHDSVYR